MNMDFGGILFFLIAFGAAAFQTAKRAGTSAGRMWLRAFLISITAWLILAGIGFVTTAGPRVFDTDLLVFSLLLDGAWAAVGAILGVVIARRRALRK